MVAMGESCVIENLELGIGSDWKQASFNMFMVGTKILIG